MYTYQFTASTCISNLTLRSDYMYVCRSRSRGDSLERSYHFLRPTVHNYPRMPPLFRGTITAEVVSAVRSKGHHATYILRMCTFNETTAVQLSITSPRPLSPQHFVPGPNMFGGTTGRSFGERLHYGIAGGKSRLAGLSPGKRDLV